MNSWTPAARSIGRFKAAGLSALALLAGLCAARGDVVTLKNGPPVAGEILSVNKKTVTVRTGTETRVIPRSAVVRVDFGTDLVTGIAANVYTNAEYRIRLTAPEGWTFSEQPGLDVAAQKGNGVLFVKALPSEGASLEEGMIRGAIGGMLANVPDAKADATEEISWAGGKARRIKVHSVQMEMVIIFIHRPGHMLMLGLGVPPAEVAQLASMLPEWEKAYRVVPE